MTHRAPPRHLSTGLLLLAVVGLAALVTSSATHAQEPSDGGEAFFGTLRFEGEPVPGAGIAALDDAGALVGSAVTASDGTWRIELPRPGTYRVTIDAETLPEGVGLRDPARQTLEVEVTRGRERPLIFPLGEPSAAGPSLGARVAQASLNGIKLGLIIAICSVGLSLIFGTTGLINFSHGELVTFGAIAAWYLNARTVELPLVFAAIAAVVLAGTLGAGLEAGLLSPLRTRKLGSFQFVAITIGLSLLARHIFLLVYGGGPERYTDFVVQAEWEFGPLSITPRDLTIMALSFVVLVGVGLVLQRTRIGKAVRAVADNVDLAESSGINVSHVTLTIWIAGAALAGLGGIFLGSVESVDWLMGFRLLLVMFAAVVLGGLGSAYGAMAGGLVIGFVTELSTVWFQPEIKAVFALAALIIVLLVRPQGILGLRERIG